MKTLTMHNTINTLKPRALPLALFLAFSSGASLAANAVDAAASLAAADGGVVVVTGTRDTRRSADESLSPIDVISAKDLQRTGQTDLRDALVKLQPSVNRLAQAGDAANLTSALTLRGLSPNHVLLLINGKRRHTSANISADPGAQQGATPVDLDLIPVSAVDHIEVLRDGAAAQYGSDAIAGVINVILKSSARGGNLTLNGGQYYKGDGFTLGSSADIGLPLGEDGFVHLSAETKRHDHSVRSGPDERTGTVVNRTLGDPQSRREAFGVNAGLALNATTELYAFGSVAHRDGESVQNYRLPNRLPQLYPNGFSPVETSNEQDGSLTAGVRGEQLAGWRWDLSATYGVDNVKIGMRDSANTDLYAATGATPTSFHLASYKNTQWGANLDAARPFDVGLPAPLSVALGAEYRRETYDVGAGDAASSYGSGAQALPGLSAISAGKHGRTISAAYADLSTKLSRQWEAELAARHERYSDAGNTSNAKLSARFQASERYALRGTLSTGFRAPSLAQEYYTSLAVSPTTAGGQLAVNSVAARSLGASALKPEKSRSVNLGLVAQPWDRFNLTVDAYRIEIRDRIIQGGSYTGATAINALTAAGISLPTGLSSVSASYFANGVDTRTQGVDVVATYTTNLGAGHIDWDLGANVNTNSILRTAVDTNGRPLLNAQQAGYLTTSTPKNKVILGGVWSQGPWGVSLHATRYGKTATEATFYSGPNIYSTSVFNHIENAPRTLTDLELRYAVSKQLQLSLGANNLFDVYPSKVPAASRYLGVYQYDTAASQTGFNGGYYYARASYTF